jgi:hypothetical protein
VLLQALRPTLHDAKMEDDMKYEDESHKTPRETTDTARVTKHEVSSHILKYLLIN